MGELRRILIIGDESLFVEALERFSPTEFAVSHATDVEEAREQCAESKPNVVVAVADGDARLTDLLNDMHRDHASLRVGLLGSVEPSAAAAQFDHLVESEDARVAMQDLARLLGERRRPPRRSWTDEARRAVQQQGASRSAQHEALTRKLEEARTQRFRAQDKALTELREAQQGFARHLAALAEQVQLELEEERAALQRAREEAAAEREKAKQAARAQRSLIASLEATVATLQTRVDGLAAGLRRIVLEFEQLQRDTSSGPPTVEQAVGSVTSEIERLIPHKEGADPAAGRQEDSSVAEVSYSGDTSSFLGTPADAAAGDAEWSKPGDEVEELSAADDGPTLTDPPATRGPPPLPDAEEEIATPHAELVVEEATASVPVINERSAITAEGPVAQGGADAAAGRVQVVAKWPYWVSAAAGLLALVVGLVLLFWDDNGAGEGGANVAQRADAGHRPLVKITPRAADAEPAAPEEPRLDAAAAEAVERPEEEEQQQPADERARPAPRRVDSRKLHLIAASRLLRRGQLVEARARLSAALTIGDDQQVREMLADSHERAGERWAAIHHLQKAAVLAPRAAQAALYVRVGALFLQLGKNARACKAFRAALQQAPDHPGAKARVGEHCT